jgi:hypothetical protein
MAIQTFKRGLPLPEWPSFVSGAPSLNATTFTLNADGEKAALVAKALAAKSIRYVYIRTGAVATGGNLDVRIETVGADGNPTGTLWAANTNVTLAVGSGDDNVWLKAGPLTADATLAVGDEFAIVASLSGAGDLFLPSYNDDSDTVRFPYGLLYTTSYAKQGRRPVFFAEYSDGSYEPILGIPDYGSPFTTHTFNSGSATNRVGNRYTLPWPCRTNGCWVWRGLADLGAFTMKLYDTDGTTVLATTGSIDTDHSYGSAVGLQFLPWQTPATLAATGPYRLVAEPDAQNIVVYDFEVPDADIMNQFPLGTSLYRSVYTSSAWVDTPTARAYMGLFIDGFADDAGAGSYDVVQRLVGSGVLG